jgi:hypothetical protein
MDRFVIEIRLDADTTLRFDKSITIDPHESVAARERVLVINEGDDDGEQPV